MLIASSAFALASSLALYGQVTLAEPPVHVSFVKSPPFTFIGEDGKLSGAALDFTSRWLQEAGLQATFTPYPPIRLNKQLKKGTVELTLGDREDPTQAPYTLRAQDTIGWINMRLYRQPGMPSDKLAMRGKRLLLVQGFTYWQPSVHHLLDDPGLALTIVYAPNHPAAVNMLLRGRADYLVALRQPTEQVLLERGSKDKLPSVSLYEIPVGLLVSRRSTRGPELLQRLESAYKRLEASGELPEWRRQMYLSHEPDVESSFEMAEAL